jgi:voltage-gated potassium channel
VQEYQRKFAIIGVLDNLKMTETSSKGMGNRRSRRSWWSTISSVAESYMHNRTLQCAVFIVSLASCAFYIVMASVPTYQSYSDVTATAFAVLFFVVFLIDYVLSIIAADRKVDYILSPTGLADLASLLPVISIPFSELHHSPLESWIGFMRFFRLLKVFHLLRYNQLNEEKMVDSSFELSEITFLTARLVISIVVFILISAGVVFYVYEIDPNSFSDQMTWFDCLYFVVVVIATVGFGDIVPLSTPARFVVIVIIIIGFSFIIPMAATLGQAILFQPQYTGRLLLGSSRTTLYLIVGIVDYELLLRFLNEIFHPSHGMKSTAIVGILSPIAPSAHVAVLCGLTRYRSKVSFFVGSSKSFADLDRVCAINATAIYIVADLVTTSLRVEEDSIFLSAISIAKYLNEKEKHPDRFPQGRSSACCDFLTGGWAPYSRPRIVVKLTSSARNRPVLKRCGIDAVLSAQEMKYSLIGWGTVLPGFLSLFQQLNSSKLFGAYQSQYYTDPRIFEVDTTAPHFSSALRELTFKETVRHLYDISNGTVFLFAVIEDNQVVINPLQSKRTLAEYSLVFIIGPTIHDITEYTSVAYDDEVASIKYRGLNGDLELDCPTANLARAKSCMNPIITRRDSYDEKMSDLVVDLDADCNARGAGPHPPSPLWGHDSDTPQGIRLHRLNTFVTSIGNLSPSYRGKRNNMRIGQHDRAEPLFNHIVLIISEDPTRSDPSSRALMLSIVYFLRIIRAQSLDHTLILTERAQQLGDMTKDIESIHPGLFHNVHLFAGE